MFYDETVGLPEVLDRVTQYRARFSDYWSPKIIGELNDAFVKAVKLKGDSVWHHHEAAYELFLVVVRRLLEMMAAVVVVYIVLFAVSDPPTLLTSGEAVRM